MGGLLVSADGAHNRPYKSKLSSRHLLPGPKALLVQLFVEVEPAWICGLDGVDLPGSRPFLHSFFALNRRSNVVVGLDINETEHTVSLDEFGYQALAMLPYTSCDVVGYANVERSVAPTRQDIHVIGHPTFLCSLGPGNKPRDDN